MSEKIKFLDMLPCCGQYASFCGGLDRAFVTGAEVIQAQRSLVVEAEFCSVPAPVEISTLEDAIATELELSKVKLHARGPQVKAPGGNAPDVLLGKAIKGSPTAINLINAETGYCTIEGKVFACDSRDIKNNARVLSFDITDGTGSIHVSKYLRADDPGIKLPDKISSGMYLLMNGSVSYNRYDQDISFEPRNIVVSKAPEGRKDTAPEKRVELHMHTCYSTLDALCDPTEIVKRAAKWGHPAVAITDHGCAQGFPEAWHAAQKTGLKVIYGVEGYFINDVDEALAVHGACSLPISTEFVAFDTETTGLHPGGTDRMTEIGAVLFKDGAEAATFNTFVNPGKPIPEEVVRLTGINDAMVKDAPNEAEAMKAFLEFAGGRPLVAHNADFDIAFMIKCAERNGIEFDPIYLDTLETARVLLPGLKRHKLDTVSNFLSLPEFNHHRASDDAGACGRIMVKFFQMLREKGVNTIDEIEAALSEERRKGVRAQKAKHIIILAKNKVGLKNLYKLISASYLEHFNRNPQIPKSLLMQHREGLIIGSACEAGELFRAAAAGKSDEELRRIGDFYDYLEIQPLCNNRFMIENGTVTDEQGLIDLNLRIAKTARDLGKPLVATCDVHFIDPEDEVYRHILLAGKKFDDADKPLPIYFRTTDEMLEEFSYLGQEECYNAVIRNPVAIAEQCESYDLLPKDLFTPKIENSEQQLKDLCYGKMHRLYGENPPQIVLERMETELHDILSRGYDVIYMSAQKLVADSLAHGYLVGSRGSVGSSLVAYMSGITEVNSLPAHYRCPKCCHTDFESGKGYGCGADMPDAVCPVCGTPYKKDGFDIPFETFLGFGGDKVPDIDLNFSGEYQANAHKYTETLFGSDHVFRAGTIGKVAEKTAYGYVKKYLEEKGIQATKAEENRLTIGCTGVKRTTSQHPGGLVIIPQDMDVTDFCPVQHPADDPNSDIITTHFEYHCMEANLLKLDELGHDDPTMIRMLEDMTGVDAKEIPLDDKDTMMIFRSPTPLGIEDGDPIVGHTGTIGIPEFGTGFTRQMLVDTQPEGFDILVRLSGFSHGTDVWLGNAKDLITSGTASVKETVGCRDDIMLYLIAQGMDPKLSFKIMENVRKGKVKKGGFQDGWVDTMKDHGVPDWYIESLSKIAYLFPKAHAVAYVMMAFRIAYFKVHHPLAFYSAYFYRRSQKDGFDAQMMTGGLDSVRRKIDEIRRNPNATGKEEDLLVTLEAVYEFYLRGFSFANIDIYESDATKFLIANDKQLRPPFVSISGLGESAANDLGNIKNLGVEFVSIEDVADACPKVSSTHIQILKDLGAMGSMPETSQISFF